MILFMFSFKTSRKKMTVIMKKEKKKVMSEKR